MSKIISTVLDPFGFGFGELVTGSDSAIVNVSDAYGMKDEDPKDENLPGDPSGPNGPTPGLITDEEAQTIAKKRYYRSGSVYTSQLGEDITDVQTQGTQLR